MVEIPGTTQCHIFLKPSTAPEMKGCDGKCSSYTFLAQEIFGLTKPNAAKLRCQQCLSLSIIPERKKANGRKGSSPECN